MKQLLAIKSSGSSRFPAKIVIESFFIHCITRFILRTDQICNDQKAANRLFSTKSTNIQNFMKIEDGEFLDCLIFHGMCWGVLHYLSKSEFNCCEIFEF